jgi:RNA polymerase sigma-70 factor (family 1)
MLNNILLHTETALLARVADGDQRAFTGFVTYYTPVVYKHLLFYIRNAAIAEELTQDVFISIWRNRERLRNMENFAGYLYVCTRNKINMAFRQKLQAFVEPPPDMLQTLLANPDAAIELKELSATLQKAIELLPARRQEVFRLSRFEHKTYDEIASLLQISKSTVKEHILEALAFLRSYLRQELGIVVSLLGCIVISA